MSVYDVELYRCQPCEPPSITIFQVRDVCSESASSKFATTLINRLQMISQHIPQVGARARLKPALPETCPPPTTCNTTFYVCLASTDGSPDAPVTIADQTLLNGLRRNASGNVPIAHFFRVPKTGSTHAVERLLPLMQCRMVVHDHGDGGVNLAWMAGKHHRDAEEHNEPMLATLREPCERFGSLYNHLRNNEHLSRLVSSHSARRNAHDSPVSSSFSMADLLSFLQHTKAQSGCEPKLAGVDCFVRAINRVVPSVHRVVLWPQAFIWPQRGTAICYDRMLYVRRFYYGVSALTRCTGGPLSKKVFQEFVNARRDADRSYFRSATTNPQLCSEVRSIYDADEDLWQSKCASPEGVVQR